MNHLTKREKEILAVLKKEPLLPQEELAERMKISRSAAAVHISNLMRKGYIVGKGYIFDERSGILVIGRTWLEICADVGDWEGRTSGRDQSLAASLSDHGRSSSDTDHSRVASRAPGAGPGRPAAYNLEICRDGETEHPGLSAGRGRIDCAYRGDGCLLAVELARRRLKPTLLTYLGKDEIGDRIHDYLMRRGVNTQQIIRSASVPTAKHLVLTNSGRALRRVEDDEGLTDLLGQKSMAAREDLIRSARVLLIDGSLHPDTMRYLASRVAGCNIVCSVVNCELDRLRDYGFLSHPHFYLVCQAGDIVAQAGIASYREPEEFFPFCRQIVGEGCFAVVVLYDDQGVILVSDEEMAYLPAPPLQTPGSVISVAAGIAEGIASGYRLRLAVRKAMGNPA
jgi:pseudouridine kinase